MRNNFIVVSMMAASASLLRSPRLFGRGSGAMKRHLQLAVGLVMAGGWVVGAGAQEKAGGAQNIPCPVDRVVNETRANNDKQGKTQPDSFYQRLAENYSKQCSRAAKNIASLSDKLIEYRAGKRSERDGYIILQKIFNSYRVLQAADTPPAQAILEQLEAITRKHPDLPNIQDFRLSEEIDLEARRKRDFDILAAQSASWSPQDKIPMALAGSKKRLIAIYQFRIEFYELPDNVQLIREGHRSPKLAKQTPRGVRDFPIDELVPSKVLTFQKTIDVYPPNLAALGESHLLVCTNPASYYSALSEDERKILAVKGRRYGTIHSIKTSGQYRDFCGVISQAGEIIYIFPVVQKSPRSLLRPLAIADGGARAAVALGEKVVDEEEDGESIRVGNIREVLIWESGKVRSVKKLPNFENVNELSELFKERKL